MSKSKEMFIEQREEDSQTLGDFLDDTYRVAEYQSQQNSEVLNEIFEAWGEIFGARRVKSKSSEDENF